MSEEKTPETPTPSPVGKTLFDARTILFFGEMKPEVSKTITEQMLAMAHVSDEPIIMLINSPGGHVESGDTIHDLIRYIKPEVKVIGTGYVASIASHIYLSAKLENRYSLPNARYLLHQPSGGMMGQETDIGIQAQEIMRTKKRINEIIAEETGQPLERIEKDTDRDFWMSAEEAIDYGMVGKIINHVSEIK